MSPTANKTPRVALVHDWLTGMRGGERLLAALCRMIPQADIFTLLHAPGTCCPAIERMRIHTSFLNDLPGVRHYYRHLLGIMPLAVEWMDVAGYDLVISSSHCVAKGIGGRRARQLHVSYCHTPMRYAWGGAEYHQRMGPAGWALWAAGGYLRAWDRRSAGKVDAFIANSAHVAGRIRRAYGRAAQVLYPPIDVDFFRPDKTDREDFYLIVSALAPYKRIDLAIEAFAQLGRPLKIIGTGQELATLKKQAPGNVELLGACDNRTVRDHYRRCRAVIFPQCEDLGMVALESAACGTAVIAYDAGGARETVLDAADPSVPAPTGLLFRPQTPQALAAAVMQFEGLAEDRLQSEAMRAWAEQFSPQKFVEGFDKIVSPLLRRKGFRLPTARFLLRQGFGGQVGGQAGARG